jgi:hypothetical protein
MEKKQTAVELLEQQLKERYSLMNSEPLFDQAKQMEKEQIEIAYNDGAEERHNHPVNGEEYYNETYREEYDNI